MSPRTMPIVVRFRAPFGPRRPTTSPRRTSRSSPSTAVIDPNRFTSPLVRRTTSCGWTVTGRSIGGLDRYGFTPSIDGPPRLRRVLEDLVEHLDIAHAFVGEPRVERGAALLRVDRQAFQPGRAAAQDTAERGTRLAGVLERLAEDIVAHARGEIDERLRRRVGGLLEMPQRLGLRVRDLP